jgi:hypothetical protein
VKNLLYFNKEGYPHNFQYNEDTESWEGKIIFDENSDETFKTQSLHIFENVDIIEFGTEADLINLEYKNNSGLTIASETNYQNELITNIIKVNDDSNFYSKWVYGKDFHKKFPIGTIISFSGVTGTTAFISDFKDEYFFSVLAVKYNAILVLTNSNNSIFNFQITSGYVNSLNMISINDYNNQLYNYDFFQNLYLNKKFSIIDSVYNDMVVSVKSSGVNYSYLNEIELNGTIGQKFTLQTQLFTERPKIFQTDVTLRNHQFLNVGRFARFLSIDQDIIFEDLLGNNLFGGCIFTVKQLIETKSIFNKKLTIKPYYYKTNNYDKNISTDTLHWNTIQFTGTTTDIKAGDIIQLSGVSGTTLYSHNRSFLITNIVYNPSIDLTIMFTPDYIIEEANNIYTINKKLQPHQITEVYVEHSCGDMSAYNDILNKSAICYSTTNVINYTQDYISGTTSGVSYNTISSFINKHKSSLRKYGIDVYYTNKNNTDYLSIESLYGTNTSYFSVSGYTDNTLMNNDFSLSNSGLTEKYNIIVNEKLTNEYTNKSSLDIYKNYTPNEIGFNLNSDIDKFGFRITVNSNEYYIDFSGNTQTTINSFIDKYYAVFYGNGFLISSGYSNEYSSYTLLISSDIDIWNLEVLVNILSTYTIIERSRIKFIKLSGNEIRSLSASFFDMELSTGMIIKITGSTFYENNKEYNIIGLTDDTISLSYQGVFIDEYSVDIYLKSREFLRKPRGEYNRDVYLRFYWETPTETEVDESIFLYDFTGDHLIPYNSLTEYIGPKPLIDSKVNNVVFLNTEPNQDLNRISNPKYQQTVFDELYFKLDSLDSLETYNWIPEPLEIFIGYNSPNEGVNSRVLKIDKIEKIENSDIIFSYTGYTNEYSNNSIPNFYFHDNILEYRSYLDFSFIKYGFKEEQLIKFYFKDQSQIDQRIFENTHTYKILSLTRDRIIIDTGYTYQYSTNNTGYTTFTDFTTTGRTFYFKIEVQPKQVLYCPIYGQTEIEDIRYKVNLNNVGVQSEEDVYQILYDSDIEDNAIDYVLFNRKRKEMLTNFREIYDYIGSYKSLVNAINYFGYNDLQLYEYYQNINQSSYLYSKLHKVLIPDIFDNSIPGWNEIDFIAGKYQDHNIWKKTNLFNLSYRITDEDGNNVLTYTLKEVQYKLGKLKKWLRKNIIPISANLVDITGVSDTNKTLYQDYDESNQTKKSVVERESTIVNFNYTATLNFGSDYLVTVNFYILSGETDAKREIYAYQHRTGEINEIEYKDAFDSILSPNDTNLSSYKIKEPTKNYNEEVPLSFSLKIKTFYLSGMTHTNPTEILVPVQYFKILKNDLTPFTFNLNKYLDPYIYIEVTTYDNSGNGLGYVNNKLFYYDEPRNHWLVNNNFDLTKMKYWQVRDFIENTERKWTTVDVVDQSAVSPLLAETNVKVNIVNNTYISNVKNNS